MNKPQKIVFYARIINVGLREYRKVQIVWKTKPRLPHELWIELASVKVAYGFKVELQCEFCGSVLDSKTYWSFHVEDLKPQMLTLGYQCIRESDSELVFQLFPNDSNSNSRFFAETPHKNLRHKKN